MCCWNLKQFQALEAAQAADIFKIRPLYVRDIVCSAKPICRDDLVQ